MKKVALALSGGLDSTILLHKLVKEYQEENVYPVIFKYGQRHSIEIEMAKKSCKRLGIEYTVIDISFIGDIVKDNCSLIAGSTITPKTAEENSGNPQVDTYVPFRNLIFSSILASFAESNECDEIYLGLNEVDTYGYWDTSKYFVENLNDVLALNRNYSLSFVTPFVTLSKSDELIMAKELSKHFLFDILDYTWSCYNDGNDSKGKECGKCNTCQEKLTGYIMAGYKSGIILDRFDITLDDLNNLL